MKKLWTLLMLLLVVFSCSTVACTTSTTKNNNPRVVLNISNGKKIEIELYPDIAPTTVENFLTLVDDGFYTNAFFHRVIDNFMIQTGGFSLEDYENGQKMLVQKSGKKTIEGEFSNNGFENNLKHTPGVISMARSDDPNSASTQFFICVSEYPSLDGNYAAFGKAVDQESIDNAIEIGKVAFTSRYIGNIYFEAIPVEAIYITSIERVN